MPAKNITIDLDQRNGLYELVRNHLGSIGDFWLAMQREKDFDKAERLGLELAEDFRLLRDIGWSEYELHQSFELTMTPLDPHGTAAAAEKRSRWNTSRHGGGPARGRRGYRPRACSRFDWWGPESQSASRRESTGSSPRRSASM